MHIPKTSNTQRSDSSGIICVSMRNMKKIENKKAYKDE